MTDPTTEETTEATPSTNETIDAFITILKKKKLTKEAAEATAIRKIIEADIETGLCHAAFPNLNGEPMTYRRIEIAIQLRKLALASK